MKYGDSAVSTESRSKCQCPTRHSIMSCNFRGTANVIAFVISILLITVDYSLVYSLLYCSRQRLNANIEIFREQMTST